MEEQTETEYAKLSKQTRIAYKALEAALFGYDITVTGYEALLHAHNATCSEIANAMGVSQPQITALTKELQRHHYITMKDSKEDRRVRICTVTKKGKELLERIG